MFPPLVLQCTRPKHFKSIIGCEAVNVRQLGTDLLVIMFRGLDPKVKSIGWAMAQAAVDQQQWQQLSSKQQLAEAAMALFKNPPVRKLSVRKYYDADLTLKSQTW